ncbi:MAG: hypothetical protein ACLRSW_12020 [Christensenellaceae bacterium]
MKKECAYIAEKSKAPVIFGLLAAFCAVWLFVIVLVYDKQVRPVIFFPTISATIPTAFFNQWHFVARWTGALSLVASRSFEKERGARLYVSLSIVDYAL